MTKNIFMEQLAGFDIIKNALISTRPKISTIVKEIYCIIMIRKRNPRSKLCCRIQNSSSLAGLLDIGHPGTYRKEYDYFLKCLNLK